MSELYRYKATKSGVQRAMGSAYISERGKYIGRFIKAEHIIAKSGAVGVDFEFESNGGERANFTLYTYNRNAEPIFGRDQLESIITCLRVRGEIAPQNRMANVWDSNERKRVEKSVPQFIELLDKPIGLLFIMEEYQAGNGDYKWRPQFSHAFEAQTELMADEIVAQKTEPQRLGNEVARLKNKPAKDKQGDANPFNNPANNPPPADYDDDEKLPF